MRFSEKEIKTLRAILEKLEQNHKNEKLRISTRRKAQLKGGTINRSIGKRKKPVRIMRKVTKKRSSIK